MTTAAMRDGRPSPHASGAVESMVLIKETDRSLYYKLVYWSDGLRVTGFFGRPKGNGPFPAVVYNRGGYLESGALQGWEVALFTEAGYVSAASQYRGNAGSEGREEFGGSDVDDVTNIVKMVKSLPYVDANRIGMMGHSRGGMMTFLALKSEALAGRRTIKAAVTVGGVADLRMLYKQDPAMTFAMTGVRPNESPAYYARRSATAWPHLIHAPLLLEHGTADERVSVAESRKLAGLVAKAGGIVKLVLFPGEDHELTGEYGGMPEALAWFQRYLALPGEDHTWEMHGQQIGDVRQWFMSSYRDGLAVGPKDVGSADRGLAAERCVSASMVVAPELTVKGCGAFLA